MLQAYVRLRTRVIDPHSQYKPISLLSILSNVFVTIINKKIVEYLDRNRLLGEDHYGFRSARTTSAVLTTIKNRISEALDGTHTAMTTT